MSTRPVPAAADQTREARIEAILKELRPKVEATVRRLVERAVDVPEAEEFGAIDLEFRDAGQQLATDVRQAAVASRKKGVRRLQCHLPGLPVRGQVPLLPTAARPDRAWRDPAPAGILLLRPVPAKLPPLRRRAGAGRRPQPGVGRSALGMHGKAPGVSQDATERPGASEGPSSRSGNGRRFPARPAGLGRRPAGTVEGFGRRCRNYACRSRGTHSGPTTVAHAVRIRAVGQAG
jgi:hypothetical protein